MVEYSTRQRRTAGSPALREPSRDAGKPRETEPELQRILNRSPAVQRQIELGNVLARRAAARPVVQRMTLGEYDTAMEALDGATVAELLDGGYEAYREAQELAQQVPIEEGPWREARLAEAAAYLDIVDLDRFRSEPNTRQAVEMVVGGIGKGEPLLLPPNPASLQDTDLLFRGTTLDRETGELFVGSGGSAHGTPATPSATIAALFATKSATEYGAEGRIVFGPVSSVRDAGFAPPDTMSGQEQEITVAAPPQATNALLGGNMAVADFRRALKLIGIDVPDSITPGQAFDARLKKAARTPLRPAQKERLNTLLLAGDPLVNIANWEELQASVAGLEEAVAAQEGRLGGLSDTEGARAAIAGIRGRLEAARAAASLEEGVAARDEAAAALEPLRDCE